MVQPDLEVLLNSANAGDPENFNALVSLAYAELRRMARSLMRHQRPGHTLQPTALVHEAYLRLVQGKPSFESRAHFFGAAARAMRQVLIGNARTRNAKKRAGAAQRVTFTDVGVGTEDLEVDILALDQALSALAAHDEGLCRTLELRYFAGFTLEDIAELRGQSLSTVKRDWSYGRAWLFDFMNTR
ncbi:MAG: sigma-70 family RNA polymerase sigma factor [Bryobacteraceae bacterium]